MTQLPRSFLTQHNVLLFIAICIPIAFFAAIPWLKKQPDVVVYFVGGIAAFIEIGVSMLLAAKKDREADEWHRGAWRFGAQWGWILGAGIVPIVMSFPQFHDLILSFARSLDGGELTEKVVLLTFMAGFAAVVLLQSLCTTAFSLGWRIWMSRAV